MRKKVLIIVACALVLVLAFAGCTVNKIESYSIPLIDLDEQVIKKGDLTEMEDPNDKKKTIIVEETLFDLVTQVPMLDETGKEVVDEQGNKVMVDDFYWTAAEGDDEATLAYKQSLESMFTHKTIVDAADEYNADRKEHYIAHPDSVLLRRKAKDAAEFSDSEEILTMFPGSHGRGPLKGKISYDGGMSYDNANRLVNTPKSWEKSQETPTLYRLTFNKENKPDANDLIVLVAGNPYWGDDSSYKANGFNVSISAPSVDETTGDTVEGRQWSEFETWYGNGTEIVDQSKVAEADRKQYVRESQGMIKAYDAIVAMSSLTRLKNPETKEWTDQWMGLFHDHNFNCYKTILSFETPEAGNKFPTYNVCGEEKVMKWSKPVKYFAKYRKIERKSNMCEVECVRSDGGQGNTLALITRSNSKKMNSLITFSEDEGETWSAPRELPAALNGERHKAEWVKVPNADGTTSDKLFITFRSIERGSLKATKYGAGTSWMSEGWVAWVGDWDDLANGTEGDFRVKLAHTYLNGQKVAQRSANGDTGYSGNVVLPSGKVATCSYGRFSPDADENYGGRTYIVGKVIDVPALFKLLSSY